MENVVEIIQKRKFTLSTASALLPIIYRLTEESYRLVKGHLNRIEAYSDKTNPAVKAIEAEINIIIDRWQTKIEKLGAEPKGLWMADFDNGQGYYCWKFPESEIIYSHGYQDGFTGRKLIE